MKLINVVTFTMI